MNLFLLCLVIASPVAVTAIIFFSVGIAKYNKTAYKRITHTSYLDMIFDKGKNGEYRIYRSLRKYEEIGFRFLFNLYLPKQDGQMTELDIVMIGSKGVFVFESKNYKGWIFGNDGQKYWTQVLYNGSGRSRKEHFYNPVWQNRNHCKVLKDLLPEKTPIHSIVLFSPRCELKSLTVRSKDVIVDKSDRVNDIVKAILERSPEQQIDTALIYEKLYPCSQATDEMKAAHISNIRQEMLKK